MFPPISLASVDDRDDETGTLVKIVYNGIQFRGTEASNDSVRKDLATLLNRLAKAPLKPQQRLVALGFYLIPRLVHRLVLGPLSAKMLFKLDRSIRVAVRHWLNLPHDVPLGFLYAPVPVGGLGILCLRTTIPGMRIKQLNGLLHSSHYPCAAAATTETMIRRHGRQRALPFPRRGVAKFEGIGKILDETATSEFRRDAPPA
ncbi:hypothetical protein MRX96_029962 [Rhipicephalus microplus]